MIKVGITGGIGSGKSTIAKVFNETFAIPLYLMDVRVRMLIETRHSLRDKLIEQFGADVFSADGEYNTKLVSSIIFKDKDAWWKLGQNISPYLQSDYQNFCDKHKCKPYIIVESAYFYEYVIENMVDFMIGVDATLPVRLARAQARDNASFDEISERMNRQMNHIEKMLLCDFIINNNDIYEMSELKKLDTLFYRINSLTS